MIKDQAKWFGPFFVEERVGRMDGVLRKSEVEAEFVVCLYVAQVCASAEMI